MKKNFLSLLVAFAAFPLMFFVACDDSSSASNDEPADSSSSVTAPVSSSVPESLATPEACDNEGAIDSLMVGNAKCTTAETKVGDECCNVGYSTFKVTYPSHSILYKYTEDGWALQGVYSDLECKEFSYDPADSCSVLAEACTEDGNNKIDSTLKSAKTSATCYSLCLNNEWKRLVIDDVKVYAHCGEPKEEGENRCCYTPPAEITEQYPWYGSAIYVYDYLFGWAVSEYYGAPNCEDPAE